MTRAKPPTIKTAARAVVATMATDAANARASNVVPIRPVRAKVAPSRTLDPSRAPHRAMRATIERDGDEAPRVLLAYFDAFNREHFSGLLGAPMILISPPGSPRAAGDYTPRDPHGFVSRIRIAPAVFRQGWRYVLGTLLHEMVHAYQHEVAQDIEKGHKGHGPGFAARANLIGAVLGFPPCEPKPTTRAARALGRGDTPRAEDWPTLPAMEWDGPKAKKTKPDPETTESANTDGDGDGETSIDDAPEIRQHERSAVLAFLAIRAHRALSRGKPKLAASIEHLAEAIERAEHHGEGASDEDA